MSVRCGQCIGCRLERSRQWAIRCLHESSLYHDNAFVTLTYSDDHLPPGGSLDKVAFQLFMKRLRKRIRQRVRFFHCGEYGALGGRPHYHALLFGFDFEDKQLWAQRGDHPVWRSEFLESLWPLGQSEIGTVSFESAAYVARYVVKKVTGRGAAAHYERCNPETGEVVQAEPEYVTMSRRPGVGRPWLDRFGADVYPSDSVIVRGRPMKPPRFYDLQYASENPLKAIELVKARRRARNPADDSEDRMAVLEECARARLSSLPRRLEA